MPPESGLESLGDAEFVAGMRAEGVTSHELVGDLFREGGIEAAIDVDRRQLPMLALVVRSEFPPLARQIGVFGVRL
jgi:hypothetical protein